MALGSWFSQIWRSAGPTIAAVAAVATGNPELAIPASQAAKATIKPKGGGVAAPIAVGPPPGQGFGAAYQSLSTGDKEIVTVGGAVLGALLLSRLLFPPGRR